MTREDRQRWDQRYQEPHYWGEREPFPLIVQYAQPPARQANEGHRLALDLACGLGHNAIWLARQGYHVLAVDGSLVALRRGLKTACRHSLSDNILFVLADLDHFCLPADRFSLICVVRFLSRKLFPAIRAALKPGGMLIYASLNWRCSETRPDIAAEYLLGPGELLDTFGDYEVIAASEEGDLSSLVARKP
jgi:SAM-dependent methyltransferase